MTMAGTDLVPEAIGAVIEAVFIHGRGEMVAPFAGLAAKAVSQYLLGRLNTAHDILRSALERNGVTSEDFRNAEQFAAVLCAMCEQRGIRQRMKIYEFLPKPWLGFLAATSYGRAIS
jgi:hypothetical protein